MHVRRSAGWVEILAPAKLNLFLEVLARRPDGFHEIETLMAPIDRFDTLRLSTSTTGQITLRCDDAALRLVDAGASYPRVRTSQPIGGGPAAAPPEQLPTGDDNLVVRAVRRLRERAGVSVGAEIQLVKRIPLAAGLAGGSSDAAAALVGANELWQLGWSREQLAEIAAELGSDIPFFFDGGAAVCRGRGERIEPIGVHAALHFVVVKPPAGLGTAAVYRACRPATIARSAAELIAALRRGCLAQIGRALHNGLQAAAESLSPWIERLAKEFSQLPFLGHQMSGSGTSYFGLCHHAQQARQLATLLRGRGLGHVWAVTSSL
jgi:4-diphosphocytidyl-2-C-methyl-D-erythritol kinase